MVEPEGGKFVQPGDAITIATEVEGELAVADHFVLRAPAGGSEEGPGDGGNEDGTGGVCYTHFWFGLRRDDQGKWVGVKEGKNYDLMTPLMTIAQHANKEFPLLAGILPELYAEEGSKPL